ncbi:GNAT family N-acetyltransferase [Variovorax sp. PvP013_2]
MTSVPTLEAAAFAAWPSERTLDLRGWHLRLDRGHTKRANSANATAHALPLRETDVDAIEDHFRRRGLTPVFRLPAGLPTPEQAREADDRLARRGYRARDPSLVMTRPLSPADATADPALAADATAWLDAFGDVAGQAGADQAAHRDILRRIAHPCAWAVRSRDGRPVCCGLGVMVDRLVGLFDIATRPDHLRRGEARRLCGALLAWGARRGADTAFLQVLAANRPAIDLYERLGFRVAYAYHYRVPAS